MDSYIYLCKDGEIVDATFYHYRGKELQDIIQGRNCERVRITPREVKRFDIGLYERMERMKGYEFEYEVWY